MRRVSRLSFFGSNTRLAGFEPRDYGSNRAVSYKDEHGKNRVRVGFTDKRATQRLANDLEKNAQRIRDGLIDPAEERLKEHRARSTADHLEEFEQSRRTKKRTDKHIKSTLNCIESSIDALGWERIGDIDAGRLELYLGEVRAERDWSSKSYNAHLIAIKSFPKWLWKMGRCAVEPRPALRPQAHAQGLRPRQRRRPAHRDRRRVRRHDLGRHRAEVRGAGSERPRFRAQDRARITRASANP